MLTNKTQKVSYSRAVTSESLDSREFSRFFLKGWLAIAKLKPLVEREFLSTNEKAWFSNSKQWTFITLLSLCDSSETNDECNVSKVQWRKQPAGGGTSRASLTVRITIKNSDPSGAGKIWENRFFTGKMDLHGEKCTQIGALTCQGPSRTCQNFYMFTFKAVGFTFLKVTFHLLQKVLNRPLQIIFSFFVRCRHIMPA